MNLQWRMKNEEDENEENGAKKDHSKFVPFLNVKHIQKVSDFRHCLHFEAIIFLVTCYRVTNFLVKSPTSVELIRLHFIVATVLLLFFLLLLIILLSASGFLLG